MATSYAKKVVLEEKAKAEEIIVITPYKSQAEKFRVMLDKVDLKNVRVSFL